jgi:hypothetical protein
MAFLGISLGLLQIPISFIIKDVIILRVSHTIVVQIIYEISLWKQLMDKPNTPAQLVSIVGLYWIIRMCLTLRNTKSDFLVAKSAKKMVSKSDSSAWPIVLLGGGLADLVMLGFQIGLFTISDSISAIILALHISFR